MISQIKTLNIWELPSPTVDHETLLRRFVSAEIKADYTITQWKKESINKLRYVWKVQSIDQEKAAYYVFYIFIYFIILF